MRTCSSLLAIITVIVLATPLDAHHSFAAEFDGTKPVVLRGTVTKVEWRNPHIWVYLDHRNADGTTTAWACEGSAPNSLTRQGWSRNTIPPGTELIIEGYRAKNGSVTCNASTWKLPDGRTVFAGSAGTGRPGDAGGPGR